MLLARYILFTLFILLASSLQAKSLENSTIKSAVENKFLELYPALKIKTLTIKALGRAPKKINRYHIEKITLSAATLKRNHGTFTVLYATKEKKRKRYFKFNLDATLGTYISTHYIKRGQAIGENNVAYQEVPFKNFSSTPIDARYFYDYESKRSIRSGKIITTNDLRRILDIKRGQLVDATLYDGNVVLNFKVKAIEEGNIGDIIKVKRGHYQKFPAKITSKNSVEILE